MQFRQLVCMICLTAASSGPALAQYPLKPVHLIVPNGPGVSTDLLARTLADKLPGIWNQAVVVENVAGASGIIASERLAKSAPDGYTLMVHPAGVSTFHPALYDKLPYDPLTDFEPITVLASPGTWMVVHPSLAANNVQELVALAKRQPGKIAYATVGGTIGFPYISSVLLKNTAGIDLTYVPYKAANQAVTDLLAGRIQIMFDSVPTSLNHVREGRLRAIAFLGPKRHFQAPDLPTIAEAGFPEVTGEGWNGMSGRKGMPNAVIRKIHADVVAVMRLPDVSKRLAGAGLQIVLNSPEEFDAQIRAETVKWGKVIRENKIRGE